MIHYTALGYHLAKRRWKDPDIDVDLRGKSMMVTGANSGIGLALTHALASRGAHVIMVCRSLERAETAAADIRTRLPDASLQIERCDLSDLRDVAALCERLAGVRLDALVNNAGVMLDSRQTSAQGYELAVATNVLSGHLLTHRLSGQLVTGGRVLHVTSGGMYSQRHKLSVMCDPPNPYDGVVQYAQTKRAQVILNRQWADQLAPTVTSNAMHPGWAATAGVERSLPRFNRLLGGALRTPEMGADTLLWLAASHEVATETGQLWFDRKARSCHVIPTTRETSEEAAALWAWCDEATADFR
ncbi:MAG: dehydrogenase/reductase SDR family protein 12 [Myxococcota bacterium]|jgi:dehydrogenase/reductase SDR family protein 12